MSLFEIAAISHPMSALDLPARISVPEGQLLARYDEAMLKPALLIADKVDLLSIRIDYTNTLKGSLFRLRNMHMRTLQGFWGLCHNPDSPEIAALGLSPSGLLNDEELVGLTRETLLNDLLSILDGKSVDNANQDRFLRKYLDYLARASEFEYDHYRAAADTDLKIAEERGLLSIRPWGLQVHPLYLDMPGAAEELYSSAFDQLSEKIAELDQSPLIDPTARIDLSQQLSHLRDQPRPGGSYGLVATKVAAHIPNLDELSIEEVLDLRDSLSDYLTGFRAEMAALSDDITSDADGAQADLAREIELRWVREIDPMLTEIRAQMAASGVFRQAINTITTDKGAITTAASSVVLATSSVAAGIAALLPAAATAAYPLIKAMRSAMEGREEARRNRLFFLYSAGEAVKRRARRTGFRR